MRLSIAAIIATLGLAGCETVYVPWPGEGLAPIPLTEAARCRVTESARAACTSDCAMDGQAKGHPSEASCNRSCLARHAPCGSRVKRDPYTSPGARAPRPSGINPG